MPQVDLEAFVSSVCSDRKIACESTTSDLPPESYFLSKDAQLEWLSDNALFDRKNSQKGNSTSLNCNSNPSSQRFVLKHKASIIGLPKPQQTCFNETKKRRNVGKTEKNRVILKRVGSLLEPSSPMVSCIGRVRSKRERSRMQRQKSVKKNRVKKTGGVLAGIKAIFRIGGSSKHKREIHASPPPQSRTRDIRSRLPRENVDKSSFVEPVVPGLGGMSRFASGRRADLLGQV